MGQVGDRVAESDLERNKPEVSEMKMLDPCLLLERTEVSSDGGAGRLCRFPRSIAVCTSELYGPFQRTLFDQRDES